MSIIFALALAQSWAERFDELSSFKAPATPSECAARSKPGNIDIVDVYDEEQGTIYAALQVAGENLGGVRTGERLYALSGNEFFPAVVLRADKQRATVLTELRALGSIWWQQEGSLRLYDSPDTPTDYTDMRMVVFGEGGTVDRSGLTEMLECYEEAGI